MNELHDICEQYLKETKHEMFSAEEQKDFLKKIMNKRKQLLEHLEESQEFKKTLEKMLQEAPEKVFTYRSAPASEDERLSKPAIRELQNLIENDYPQALKKCLISYGIKDSFMKHILEKDGLSEIASSYEEYMSLVRDFCNRNHGLVMYVTCRTHKKIKKTVPIMDLILTGYIGLMKSVHSFNRENTRFSTYAIYRIKREINLFLKKEINNQNVLSSECEKKLSECEKKVKEKYYVEAFTTPPSIEFQRKEDYKTLKEKLTKILTSYDELEHLTEKEVYVLKHRFGLEGCKKKRLREIGSKLGVSYERIRQIETKALEKLREYPAIQKLEDFLD